jgi:hypothetical protein
MTTLLELVKSPRFQSALVGALLGAVSTFVLSYWGIHLDFSSVVPVADVAELSETELVEDTSLDEVPDETIEVIAE